MLSNTSSTSKKKKIVTLTCQQTQALLDHSIEKSSSDFDTSLHFFSSLPVACFRINQLLRGLLIYSNPSRFVIRHIVTCSSSSIAFSEGVKAIFLATCQSVEVAKKESFERVLVDLYLKEKDNDAFFNQYSSDNRFSAKKKRYNDDENELDNNNEDNNNQVSPALWIDSGAMVKARNKLIRIFKRKVLILQ